MFIPSQATQGSRKEEKDTAGLEERFCFYDFPCHLTALGLEKHADFPYSKS